MAKIVIYKTLNGIYMIIIYLIINAHTYTNYWNLNELLLLLLVAAILNLQSVSQWSVRWVRTCVYL